MDDLALGAGLLPSRNHETVCELEVSEAEGASGGILDEMLGETAGELLLESSWGELIGGGLLVALSARFRKKARSIQKDWGRKGHSERFNGWGAVGWVGDWVSCGWKKKKIKTTLIPGYGI